MSNYEQMRKRLDAMPVARKAWIEGFIMGLAYTQAQDPTVDDRPIKVDFPIDPLLTLEFYKTSSKPLTVQEFVDVWHDLDDEGGILDIRFTAEKFHSLVELTDRPGNETEKLYLKINLASTEGHRGIPEEWEQADDDPALPSPFITDIEEAQRVLDQSRK